MDQLVKSGHVERAVMGIGIVDADENDASAVGLKQITGVVVKSYTDDNSPAKKAGIQLGDVIVALDGESIDNTPQLQQKVAFKKPGETVEITVLRQGGDPQGVAPHPRPRGRLGGDRRAPGGAEGRGRGTAGRPPPAAPGPPPPPSPPATPREARRPPGRPSCLPGTRARAASPRPRPPRRRRRATAAAPARPAPPSRTARSPARGRTPRRAARRARTGATCRTRRRLA